MVRILKDDDLQALEANINGIIREEYGLKVKDVKIESYYGLITAVNKFNKITQTYNLARLLLFNV